MSWAKLSKYSSSEWTIRLFLATCVAIFGYFSVTRTLAYSIRESAVQEAHQLANEDGRITGLLAVKIATEAVGGAERLRSDQLARQALQNDPTAVAAVLALGINAQVRGDIGKARLLLAYSKRLSRRDFLTQVWAVEDAVGRGDIVDALTQYDIALRTSEHAPEVMFPVLASAISEPTIRRALAKTISARPLWYPSFVSYVTQNGPDIRANADLLRALHEAHVPVFDGADSVLITSLLSKNQFEEAWAYYAGIRPGSDRRFSRDPHYAARLENPSPLDWKVLSDGGISTSIESGNATGVVSFAAPPSVGGSFITQMQILPAGRYLLQGHSEAIDQPEDPRLYWVLICREGRELGRVPVPNSVRSNGIFFGQLDVPPGCPVQALTLVATPSASLTGLSGRINWTLLSPMR